MALGRLGSREFDVLSDADVLFVAADSASSRHAARAAERIMEILTAYTREGTLFPVDTRLRPLGREGELVTTPERLIRYFGREVQAWEALTYLRLRHVGGDRAVAEQAGDAVRQGITRTAARPQFNKELVDMRRRLEESDSNPNLKTGIGGAYDIDYLAGRLQAKHGLWSHANLSERVRLTAARGLISEDDAAELARHAEFLRTLEHCIRMVTGRAGKWLPPQEHARESVAKLMFRPQAYTAAGLLADAATEVVRRTREIYLRYPF
jgi:glutamate-ammonia-ligase adenylyltransferase